MKLIQHLYVRLVMDGCAALTIQSDLVNEMGVPLYLGSPGEGPISLAFGMQNIEHLRPTPLISINQSTGPALFGGQIGRASCRERASSEVEVVEIDSTM